MGPRVKDLSGLVVGRLSVIWLAYVNHRRQAVWLCWCACGCVVEVIGVNLTSKTAPTRSCGCLKSDWRHDAQVA